MMEKQSEINNRYPLREISNLDLSNKLRSEVFTKPFQDQNHPKLFHNQNLHLDQAYLSDASKEVSPDNSPVITSMKLSRLRSKSQNNHEFSEHNYEPDYQTQWAFEDEELPIFPTETTSLRVLVVTWNLHGKKPKDSIEPLFNAKKVKHHIISIGTEECLRSIPASTLYPSKSHWVNLIRISRNQLDQEYVLITSQSMNALHLSIFVHRSILKFVSGIESAQVRNGFGKLMGNKGAVGICFKICDAPFLFLNCHLACQIIAGQNEIKQRNEDFERIVNDLELPEGRVSQEKKLKQKSTIMDRFDFIFWSGDFNYRLNQTRENVIELLKKKRFDVLLKQDQLAAERKKISFIYDFLEGEIKFPPTYKYQVHSRHFENKKKRVPSWTDRIFGNRYKSRNEKAQVIQVNYGSLQNVTSSDHRPVFAQFVIKPPVQKVIKP